MIVPSLKAKGLYVNRSAHFSPGELYDSAPFAPKEPLVFKPLLDLVEAVRVAWGKPLHVNAGVRTQAKQNDLKRRGYKTASYSPHVWCCALDLDTRSKDETRRLVETIRKASKTTGIPARIGWRQYESAGQTFVHVDVAPLLAAEAHKAKQIPAWVVNSWSARGLEW